MLDFTNFVEEFNNYKGSEKKKTLIYNGKKYNVRKEFYKSIIKYRYKIIGDTYEKIK